MPVDPVPCEVVRNREHKRIVVQLPGGNVPEPGAESRVVERSLEAVGYFKPKAFSCQLLLARQRRVISSTQGEGTASITVSPRGLKEVTRGQIHGNLQGVSFTPHDSPQVWTTDSGFLP